MKTLHNINLNQVPGIFKAWADRWPGTPYIWKNGNFYSNTPAKGEILCNVAGIKRDEKNLRKYYPHAFNDPAYMPPNLKVVY